MTTLSVQRKPSYWLTTILSLAHLAAAVILWTLMLTLDIKLIVTVTLIISLIYYLRQDALLTANSAVIAFELSNEMQCTLTIRSGESIVCSILSSTFVAPYLTVLNLKPAEKLLMFSVVILPDSMNAEEFRQLRIWLRWKWKNGN